MGDHAGTQHYPRSDADTSANADTSYALAYLVRPPADVVVITARAPTFAPGSHPSRWPARGEDVRYWSMCIGLFPIARYCGPVDQLSQETGGAMLAAL